MKQLHAVQAGLQQHARLHQQGLMQYRLLLVIQLLLQLRQNPCRWTSPQKLIRKTQLGPTLQALQRQPAKPVLQRQLARQRQPLGRLHQQQMKQQHPLALASAKGRCGSYATSR
jgi:hypothetical protein